MFSFNGFVEALGVDVEYYFLLGFYSDHTINPFSDFCFSTTQSSSILSSSTLMLPFRAMGTFMGG